MYFLCLFTKRRIVEHSVRLQRLNVWKFYVLLTFRNIFFYDLQPLTNNPIFLSNTRSFIEAQFEPKIYTFFIFSFVVLFSFTPFILFYVFFFFWVSAQVFFYHHFDFFSFHIVEIKILLDFLSFYRAMLYLFWCIVQIKFHIYFIFISMSTSVFCLNLFVSTLPSAIKCRCLIVTAQF